MKRALTALLMLAMAGCAGGDALPPASGSGAGESVSPGATSSSAAASAGPAATTAQPSAMAPTNRPPVASEEWDYIPDEVAGPQTDDPRCSRPTDEDISYFTGMFGGSPTQWAEVAAIVTAFSRPNGDRYIVAARADGVTSLARPGLGQDAWLAISAAGAQADHGTVPSLRDLRRPIQAADQLFVEVLVAEFDVDVRFGPSTTGCGHAAASKPCSTRPLPPAARSISGQGYPVRA